MPDDQLPFPLAGEPIAARLPARIAPMRATPVDAPFDDPGYLFEPWWPGVRALAFAERGRLTLHVEGLADALAAFPELRPLPSWLDDDGAVLDGTLLVLDRSGRADPELLRRRLAAPGAGRPAGRPAFVAADLLWSGFRPLMRRPFRARRDRLIAILPPTDRAIVGRGYVRDGLLLAEALAELGIGAISARQLSARHRSGPAGEAWLRAPILAAAVRLTRPSLALIMRLPLEGGG